MFEDNIIVHELSASEPEISSNEVEYENYIIEEAIEIINNCDESFNPNTKHFDVRNVQRFGDFGLIFETFLYNPLMGIIKQDYNKF